MTRQPPAQQSPAPTVRDEIAVTRLDGPAPTVRDDVASPRTLMQLPSALAGRYRIAQQLPAGGEADLLLVAAADGQRCVAKIYRYGIQVKTEVLDRLVRAGSEAVARLVEYGQSDGHCYEVLEYLPEGSLRSRLAAGPLAEEQARALVVELSAALALLHEHDILHRDLKPENVLIRQWQPLRIALTDFGIASVAEATQHFTTVARTLRYAAPEAATGVIGTAADYWSLGMLVLEALSGRHPFAGLSDAVLSYQLVTQPVDCGGVAEPWHTLCRGLLLRDPKRRWGRAEVARWLAGDASLRLLVEDSSSTESRVQRSYRLGRVECWTARELAVQMAKQWEVASRDLGRGFITDWLRNELHDQDLARAALDVLDDRNMSADERLLRVLVKMAPDFPPVWKQWSLATDDLIAAAHAANRGDETSRALFSELYQIDVLGIYADVGNAECQQTQKIWSQAVVEYKKTLEMALANGGSPRLQPDLAVVLPSLLLVAVSRKVQEELRTEIQGLAERLTHYPAWLNELLKSSSHNGTALAIKIIIQKLPDFLLIAGRYRDNGDGTVTDVQTGLQWMRFSLGQEWKNGGCVGEAKEFTWQQALDAAEALNLQGGYSGHRDWRVPTKKELKTLIYCSSGQPKTWNDMEQRCEGDYERPTIYKLAFPNTPKYGWYWSFSTCAYGQAGAWLVDFYYGRVVDAGNKCGGSHARLVRGGQ